MRLITLLLATAMLSGCSQVRDMFGGLGGSGGRVDAYADMRDSQGRDVGRVTLEQTPNGVLLRAELQDMPMGTHGFHIHEVGRCDAPQFTTAGGHFNPFGRRHGIRNPQGSHAGDLPNIEIDQTGRVSVEVLAREVTLDEGAGRLFDADGSAIMVHASADDYQTDPAGDAGARIACGVVTR